MNTAVLDSIKKS